MKRILTAVWTFVLLLSLVGCSDVSSSGVSSSDSVNELSSVVSEYETGNVTADYTDASSVAEGTFSEEETESISNEDTHISDESTSTIEEMTLAEETKPVEETKSVEETKPSYVITEMSKTMYAATSANVRSEPAKNSNKLGTLSKNDEVSVTGKVDNGWYRVNYNGADGFVKGNLLSSEKIVVQENPELSGADSGSSNHSGKGGNGGSSGVTVPSVGDTEGDLVWIPTKGGKKYHSKASCSNMENPMQVTREHAEANGFTPCKRCH